MLRLLTAGESHGKSPVGVLEGLSAGVPISPKEIAGELARRRHGHGRSGRQKLETDRFEIQSGVRHGRTLGSPIAVTIDNAEWEQKYRELMSVEGHADLAGVQKYGFDDVRNVLERASARETAMRVALGVFCKAFLAELGIDVVSHVVRIGSVAVGDSDVPGPEDLEAVDSSPVRCFDDEAGARMVEEIDRIRKERDTVGGVFEVLAYGSPPGLGSHVQYDRKLDARLALALMSIQSVKGVEVGDGFATASRPGSEAHDEIAEGFRRTTARAGGVVIVYLVGMPGSGKSTVGPVLAGRLGVPFVELDAEVERAAGASVSDIFDREGEARFRELEAAALVDVARRDPSVVSCGGGVVLEPANRVTLRATGEVVFLSVPLHVLRERVRPASDRPLIREEGDLERLFKEREPLYREFAAHVVDASGPVEEVAAAIQRELLRWSA